MPAVIHPSAPPTLPNRSAGFCRSGHIRRGGLLRHVAVCNIRTQLQDPEILIFCYKSNYEKLGHILKPLVPKFRPDLSARLKDISEKQVPAKLKPIVVFYVSCCLTGHRVSGRGCGAPTTVPTAATGRNSTVYDRFYSLAG